jgi:predicted RNA-binding protein YlqC (UPF0109 family)
VSDQRGRLGDDDEDDLDDDLVDDEDLEDDDEDEDDEVEDLDEDDDDLDDDVDDEDGDVDDEDGDVEDEAEDLEDDEDEDDDDLEDEVDDGEPGETATDVLEYLVKALVGEPDAVDLDVEERRGTVSLRVRVAPDDMGRVIGKRGRTANAIRTVVRAAAVQDDVDVDVDFVD